MSEIGCWLCGQPTNRFVRCPGSDWNIPLCYDHPTPSLYEEAYDPDKILTTTDSRIDEPQTTQTIDLFIWAGLACILIILLGLAVLMMS